MFWIYISRLNLRHIIFNKLYIELIKNKKYILIYVRYNSSGFSNHIFKYSHLIKKIPGNLELKINNPDKNNNEQIKICHLYVINDNLKIAIFIWVHRSSCAALNEQCVDLANECLSLDLLTHQGRNYLRLGKLIGESADRASLAKCWPCKQQFTNCIRSTGWRYSLICRRHSQSYQKKESF